jgi:acyl carrier protein
VDQCDDLSGYVREAIASACNLDISVVHLQMSMSEIGLDSLSLVSVVTYVGMLREVEFSNDEIVEFFQGATVGDLVRLIERAVRVRHGS